MPKTNEEMKAWLQRERDEAIRMVNASCTESFKRQWQNWIDMLGAILSTLDGPSVTKRGEAFHKILSILHKNKEYTSSRLGTFGEGYLPGEDFELVAHQIENFIDALILGHAAKEREK